MKSHSLTPGYSGSENRSVLQDGIPALKLKKVLDSIAFHKKMVALTVLGNTIIAILAAVYVY